MPKHTPYHYKQSENGTFYTEGPGYLFRRFDTEMEAEHFVMCLNEAWSHGRRTGHQDVAIAQAIKQEPMKPHGIAHPKG